MVNNSEFGVLLDRKKAKEQLLTSDECLKPKPALAGFAYAIVNSAASS